MMHRGSFHFTVGLLALAFAAIVLGACARREARERPPSTQASIVDEEKGGGQPVPPSSATDDPSRRDPGDDLVSQATAPDSPALPPPERFASRPRQVPPRPLVPDSLPPAKYQRPPVFPARLSGMRPPPPVERVPRDLGDGSTAVPAKPPLPVVKGLTERTRDVNRPPELPPLGQRVRDRVGFEDPTTELSHAAIIEPVVKVPLAPSSFSKVVIPDPFEFADQIKLRLPPSAEPGLTPVPVNPRRVK